MRRSSCTSCMPALRDRVALAGRRSRTPSSITVPAARRHHAHQALQRRALAGAVAPEQRHDLVRLDPQRDVEQDVRVAVIAVQALDLEQAHARALRGRRRDRLPAPAALPLISSGVPSTSTRPSCSTVTRSASSNSASMSWSITIMVRPWLIDFSSFTVSTRSLRAHAGQRLVEQQQARRRSRAPGRSRAGASRHRRARDTGVSARAVRFDQLQRLLDLLARGPGSLPRLRNRSSRNLPRSSASAAIVRFSPHRQLREQLVDLIALGQAELADVGDALAGDVAALEHDRARGRRDLAGQHLEEGRSCRRRSGR